VYILCIIFKYVKEFDFGTYKAGGHVKPSCKQDGGSAVVGPAKVAPAMANKGGTMRKAKGGTIEKATGERYTSREAMVKHEKKETPRMKKEEVIKRTKTEGVIPRSLQARPMPAPTKRPISVASRSPLLALQNGGNVSTLPIRPRPTVATDPMPRPNANPVVLPIRPRPTVATDPIPTSGANGPTPRPGKSGPFIPTDPRPMPKPKPGANPVVVPKKK
jgi:hypothetical protein